MAEACEVRFTRYYDAPPDEVWAALTEPASLERWLAPPGTIDLSPGGSFELRSHDGQTLAGSVRAVEQGRLLELAWVDSRDDPSIVRFELTGDAGGTVLVLDHRRISAEAGMRYAARWTTHLDRLDAVVAGSAVAR